MPPYRRYGYYRRYQRRYRRNRFLRWRARKPFQRTRRYQRRYRRRRKVKRFKKLKRKATKITVKQFQPNIINKCKIVGYKCLFQGSTKKISTNYIQYIYSTVPPYWPSGGGWSILVFSLTSLFEDWEHLENLWTKSNMGLPLVKYRGCKLKLYQSYDTDYVAVYDRCWPMVDTDLTHPDSAPSRMLQRKHKIVVPSRKTSNRKKPYKKVFIKPPSQMQTQWYFQKDICKLPLLMLTTTSCDLLYPFCSPHAESNNITIPTLSTFLFQNLDFTNESTEGYYPKKTDTNEKLWMYASHLPIPNFTTETKSKIQDFLKQLIPLKNTRNNQPGTQILSNKYTDQPKDWGNPFHKNYITDNLSEDNYDILLSKHNVATIKSYWDNDTELKLLSFTKATGPMIYYCRYNPASDKGEKNRMYLVSTHTQTYPITPPENTNLIIEGFPLFILTWSWTDWVKKTKITPDIDKYRILVIETDQLNPKQSKYIPIDLDFIHGLDPYTPTETHDHISVPPDQYNALNWHPKFLFQQQTTENIAQSGPAVHRTTNHKYIQAYCKYTFYFSWGGCPKQLPKPFEPCFQPKWTTANNLPTRLEITNPNRPPETELYSWDWEEDYVKSKAIERITRYTETDQPTFSSTGNKNNPAVLQKVQEKEKTAEKEEETILQQLFKLRHQRLLLELQTQQLLRK
nr:MAG: ORF1 [TTV-like mini virus]